MPFEMGIFYGAMKLGEARHRQKQGFAFDEDARSGLASFSDFSGIDVQPHKGQPVVVLICIQRYLATRATWKVVAPGKLLALYLAYVEEAPHYCLKFGLVPDQLVFTERRGLMASWLEEKAGSAPKPG